MEEAMKKIIILCLCMFTVSTFAKRLPYTHEILSGADLVGIWTANEVKKGKLTGPQKLLKGDPGLAPRIKDKKLAGIIKKLKDGEKLILVIFKIREEVRIASNHGVFEANDKNIKMIKDIINQQIKGAQSWPKFSIKEQIENSALIVRGKIIDKGRLPRSQFIKVHTTYKGDKKASISIYPVSGMKLASESEDSLFLVQKMSGTGPEFIVMKKIPWKESEPYLKLLKSPEK